jgi:uncharacterized membrane protein YbhN (UPF0104 family)
MNAELRVAPGRRFPIRWLVHVLVSALVLGVTLWLLPTREVWGTIRGLPPTVWLFSLCVFLLGHFVSALKWRLLISDRGEVPIPIAFRAHFAGLVANLCLPGAAGGDVVRAGLVIRGATDKARVAVGSLADRVVDTLSVFTLACLGAALSTGRRETEAVVLRVGCVLGCLAVGGVGLSLILRRLPIEGRVGRSIQKLGSSLEALRRRPGSLALCFGLSFSVQIAFVGVNILLASQSGVAVSPAAWFFAWSAAKLLAVLPISAGGLGVREASLAAFLSPFGAPAERVVAVGLMWQSILLAGGLLGGLLLILVSRSKRSEVLAEE